MCSAWGIEPEGLEVTERVSSWSDNRLRLHLQWLMPTSCYPSVLRGADEVTDVLLPDRPPDSKSGLSFAVNRRGLFQWPIGCRAPDSVPKYSCLSTPDPCKSDSLHHNTCAISIVRCTSLSSRKRTHPVTINILDSTQFAMRPGALGTVDGPSFARPFTWNLT